MRDERLGLHAAEDRVFECDVLVLAGVDAEFRIFGQNDGCAVHADIANCGHRQVCRENDEYAFV